MEAQSKQAGLTGFRVLSLESRRAPEIGKLIESYGGQAVVAPSMRELPLESNAEALNFARVLASSGFDAAIFLTGVGTRLLARAAEMIYPRERFVEALRKVTVVARGPKPAAALKELGIPIAVTVPMPGTWRELLAALDRADDSLPMRGCRVALQEYGSPNQELLDGLAERGAIVTRVPVYEWALPEDVGPLRAAVEKLASGQIDVALFTSSVQLVHLLRVAREMNLEQQVRVALARIAVGAIGPVTSEGLRDQGIGVDFEPDNPKMGFLVNEAARQAAGILAEKRKQPRT